MSISDSSNIWLGWILASSFCLSFYDLCKKASVKGNAVFPTLLVTTFSGWAALTAHLAASGGMGGTLSLGAGHVALLLVKSCIVAASWTATYFALKTLPITCAAPIRATGPLWTFAGAVLFFAEVPGLMQSLGMALVMAGCFFFSRTSAAEASAGGARAVAFAFAGTLLGSCSALYDKHLLQGLSIPATSVLWWFLGGMCIIFAVAAALSHGGFRWRWSMPLTGILLAMSDAAYFNAIAVPDSRISVLSLIRRSSIILTFFIGGAVFREKDLKRRSLALAAILIGVTLLCIFS